MAISVLAGALVIGSTNSNTITSGTYDTSGGTGLIVPAVDFAGASGIISDSKSNTWASRTGQTSSGMTIRVFDCVSSPTVGSGHTFTATGTATFPSLGAIAMSGSGAFDLENGAASGGNVTSLQAGSITPSQDNCIVVAALAVRQAVGGSDPKIAIDSGFTIIGQIDNDGQHFATAVAYKIQTTAAAVNPTWSWTNSEAAAAVIASYKAASTTSTTDGKILIRPSGFA